MMCVWGGFTAVRPGRCTAGSRPAMNLYVGLFVDEVEPLQQVEDQ